ncbi:MAG: glycosyltransferase, partial [bacterium]|nr:glycosyltransferase [bacterium]
MQNLRILTFNWHDPYLAMFSRVGHRVEVGDWMSRADGTTGWDLQKRPLPDNLSLIRDARQAAEMLRSGGCDLVLCHTVQDLAFVAPFDVPTVFLTHNALHNDAMNDPEQIQKIRSEVGRFLAGREGVFAAISPMKLKSWDLDGFVVRPGIHLEDYSGYTGKEAAALAVGNLFVERDFMLGYRYLREIVEGVPHKIVGKNPTLPQARKAESWEDLKGAYREYRGYVNTTVEAFEDGYNLGMLEAMATGMPVVALKNATSPIRDGENGYISDDTGRLRDRVKALLKDEVLARKLGQAARKTVAEMFSVDVFVQNWNEIFEACLSRAGRANRSAVSVKLTFGQEDVYPFTAADVSTFLSVPDLGRITVPALKLDRLGEAYLCDVFLYDLETDRQMVWQGLEVYLEGEAVRVAWPAFLAGLEEGVRAQVEQVVSAAVQEVVRQGVSGASVHVGLQEVAGFTPRVGEDRVTPGDARSDIFLHHAKRYAFARPFCKNKQVVDIGSGTGYGSQILARDATRVVSVDLSVDAHRYAARTFSGAPIHRLAGDIRAIGLRDGSFDTAVCFEAIEHIREHEDFLEEVCRLLRPDGTFVVSTPNKRYYDLPENENPYHVGMLELEAFRALLSRHFENVQVYGQKRMQTGASYYEAFDFRDGAREEDEVFVAVCREPRAGESTEMAQGRAPAVHVKGAQRAGRGRPLKVLVSQVSNPISAGRYVVDAFRQAHEVLTCGPVIDTDELAQWREAEKQHALKPPGAGEVEKMGLIARLARPCDIPMPRGQVDIQQALERLPKGWRPDLFVWVDSATGFLPMGLEKLDCPAACLVGDTHTGQMDWRLKYAQMFRDVFLMFNRQHIPNFQDAGCSRVHWLPGACDPKVHGRIEAEKSYDVGFVGQTHRQWHPHRVRLLERLVQAGFDVHIESKILEEMALFYSRSKIVFNRSLNNDLNMRVYEAMCSGSLLLSDRLPAESGLGDLFQDREHLVLYDEENLEEVARYYLEHESEREAIAARGRNAVLAGHTYAHRVDQMVEAVFEAEADGIAKCVEEKERVPARSGRVSVAENPPGEDAVCELAEYTGERPEVVRERLPKAGVALAQEWNQGDRNSEVGVDAFYKETNEYLYDLTHFNYTPMYTGWRGAIYNLCQQVSESMADFQVLDYGGGIGTTLI